MLQVNNVDVPPPGANASIRIWNQFGIAQDPICKFCCLGNRNHALHLYSMNKRSDHGYKRTKLHSQEAKVNLLSTDRTRIRYMMDETKSKIAGFQNVCLII